MDPQLAAEILTGDSDELSDLKANFSILEGFIALSRQLDAMPDVNKRFYEESRSLYQATSLNRDINTVETLLSRFFGPPVKPAGKPLTRKLSKESALKYLGGIEKEQSLFLLHLKTGAFYGALWPWRRNKTKIEIHMGYCSDWMIDEDYHKLETFVKRSLSRSAFEQIDTQVGGQIRGIALSSFLQMTEMEQANFSLRVTATGKIGHLHIVNGKLIGAQTDDLKGAQAAYRIISWDDAVIEITPAVQDTGDSIQQPLMHILMESLKIKDEFVSADIPGMAAKPKTRRSKPAKQLVRLERIPGPRAVRKKILTLTTMAIVLGTLVILGAGAVVGLQMVQNREARDGYQKLMEQIATTDSLDQKLSMLEVYHQAHGDSVHVDAIQSEIQKIRVEIEDRDFDQITLKISSLPVDETYEKTAISLYSDFLGKHPDSRYSGKINETIGKIKNLLDQYYYEELKQAARLDFSARLEVYRSYHNRFPKGTYYQDVDILINDMGREYLKFLQTEEAKCEQSRRWENCIQRYDDFINNFINTPLAQDATIIKATMLDRRDLAQLKRLSDEVGNDYQKAYQNYTDYLASHPDTTQKKAIENELTQLDGKVKLQRQWQSARSYASSPSNPIGDRMRRLDSYLRNNLSGPYAGEAQELMDQLEHQQTISAQQQRVEAKKMEVQTRLKQEQERKASLHNQADQLRRRLEGELTGSPRYRPNGDGTFTDLTTGAMWCLLDSFQELGGCMTYEAAVSYVRALRNGGYGDWRMPTANELAGLYKKEPFFPGGGAPWYWSSEAYSKGYHSVVDIVTTKPKTVFERENRTQNECGAARAIRP